MIMKCIYECKCEYKGRFGECWAHNMSDVCPYVIENTKHSKENISNLTHIRTLSAEELGYWICSQITNCFSCARYELCDMSDIENKSGFANYLNAKYEGE